MNLDLNNAQSQAQVHTYTDAQLGYTQTRIVTLKQIRNYTHRTHTLVRACVPEHICLHMFERYLKEALV